MSKLNLSPCTIKQAKKNLLAYYLKALQCGIELNTLDAIFLWSLPGLGKSQMIQQIADEIREKSGKPVKFIEIRLSECSLFELIGLMHRDPVSNTVIYDAPPLYNVEDEDSIVIYLFDELDKATKQLQNAALHLVLDKKFWQYSLPDNSIVVAAGNPENIEGELFSKFSPELNNRFRHYLLESDFLAWKSWAVENDVSHLVIDFLEANQHLLYTADKGLENITAFNTPRTWTKVSDYLKLMYEDDDIDWNMAYLDIVGYIGIENAPKFKQFCSTKGLMPKVEDIVKGKCRVVPKRADIKDAVSKSLISYIYSHKDCMDDRDWTFIREYIELFPEEYVLVFYRNIATIGAQKCMLSFMSNQEKVQWKRLYGKCMNFGEV